MKNDYGLFQSVRLFQGINPDELCSVLTCIKARSVQIKKGGFVLAPGEPISQIGIVLSGCFHIVREEIDGGRSIVDALSPGDFFGEALCCADVASSPIGVLADTAGVVMLLDYAHILRICPNSCSFHRKLLENMLGALAEKSLWLQERMRFLHEKTIRKRLICYLTFVAAKEGKAFSIPFNREALADFLCIDRSALSRELGRLKRDGVIDYWKNHFRLL